MRVLYRYFTLLASLAEAIPMYRSCLRKTENFAGNDLGYEFTNRNQLIGLEVTDEMRLHSFNICTNSNGYITGLQFGLSEEAYHSIDQFLGPEVVLGAIGDVSSDCKSYVLDGSITRIRAYKGALPGIRSMAFYRGNTVKIFGQEKDEYTER